MTASNPTVEATEVVSLFPTYVWCTQLKREDYEVINQPIKRKLAELTAGFPRLEPGDKWQTDQELHKLQEFQGLNTFIYESVKSVLEFLKVIYDDFEITGCWANISAAHARHEAHTHPNNYLSGVYYVQTHEGADTIVFMDPRMQAHVITPSTMEGTPGGTGKARLRVRDGTLVIFPSWLAHGVEANMSDEERISLSFNIIFSSLSEKIAKPKWKGDIHVK